MAVLEIVKYPALSLRDKTKRVEVIDDEIKKIVADMYETMYARNGVGLAANQVGIDKQIFVMDVSDTRDVRYCAINPEIVSMSGVQTDIEGCLSVTKAYDRVKRAAKVHLRALDINGKPFEIHGEGLMAACMQHEVDHLNGLLFLDRLSKLKLERLRKKMAKQSKG